MEEQRPAPKVEMNQDKINQIKKVRDGNKSKKVMMIVLVILLIVAAGFGGWYYANMQAKKDLDAKDAQISQLEQDKADLQGQLDEANKADDTTDDTTTGPSQETLDNVEAAFNSKNLAALEGYMAKKVTVTIAASECCGSLSASDATSEINTQLGSATTPWDFDLDEATISKYQSGDYAQYFPEGATVGQSKNNYVVSITFDDSGDIESVFITGDSSLL